MLQYVYIADVLLVILFVPLALILITEAGTLMQS
jgi:hypothetical protein